jgi:hypothetical protein
MPWNCPAGRSFTIPGAPVPNARTNPMTGARAMTSDHINRAVKTLAQIRPKYSGMPSFYRKIFIAHEDAKSDINLEPIHLTAEGLATKIREKLPLVNMNEFVVDTEAGHNLIKKTLAFITYSSNKPSITLCAEQLSNFLEKDLHDETGYCPICGNIPRLSTLRDEGKRFLHCSFCWHEWVSKRVYCPFCDNTDSKSLHYFFSEEERDYRIYVCDNCKKYLKTVNSREADRLLYPPLEQVSSLHLDFKAQEIGFESGMPLELSL